MKHQLSAKMLELSLQAKRKSQVRTKCLAMFVSTWYYVFSGWTLAEILDVECLAVIVEVVAAVAATTRDTTMTQRQKRRKQRQQQK